MIELNLDVLVGALLTLGGTAVIGLVGYLLKRHVQSGDETTAEAKGDRRRIEGEAKAGRRQIRQDVKEELEKQWRKISDIDNESMARDNETRESVTELRNHVNAHFVRHRDLEDIKTTLTKIEKKQDSNYQRLEENQKENYQELLSHLIGRD